MNCETYETLRIEAAEAPGLAEHLADCQPCQSFHHAAQWMDRELPLLDAPQLPAGFVSQVAAQARAERVLRPWYRRLTQDAADAAEAMWRSLAVGGLVGGLAGVLGAGAVATRYGSIGRFGVYNEAGRWGWTSHAWGLHEHFLGASAVLLTLLVAVLGVALRPWSGVRRVVPLVGTLLALLALLAATQTAGLLPLDGPPSGLEGLGGAGLLVGGVTLLLLAGRGLLRTATGTIRQAVVFYGTLAALYGLVELQQHWLDWTGAFRGVAQTATFVLDPRLVLGGSALWVGLMAGALTAVLVLLREPAGRRGAVPLLLLLGVALTLAVGKAAVLALVRPPTLALSPGPAQTWTFVAPTQGGPLFQDRLPVHDWQTEGNRAVLDTLRAGSPLDRFYAAELRLCQDRLAWDRPALERDVLQATHEAAGLASLQQWGNPWWELLPAGSYQHDAEDQLTAVITDGGRPVAGARLFVAFDYSGGLATSPWTCMSTLRKNDQAMEQVLGGDYPPPGRLDASNGWMWGVSNAEGRVEIPRWYGPPGQLRPMLLLPGDAPVRAVEGLPVVVAVPEHCISLGTITVRR